MSFSSKPGGAQGLKFKIIILEKGKQDLFFGMVDSEIVLQYFLSKVKLKLNKGNCFSIFLQIKFKLTKQNDE